MIDGKNLHAQKTPYVRLDPVMDPILDARRMLQSQLDTLQSEYDLLENAATPDYQRITSLQEQIDYLPQHPTGPA